MNNFFTADLGSKQNRGERTTSENWHDFFLWVSSTEEEEEEEEEKSVNQSPRGRSIIAATRKPNS
jgi:hypothetical protein